MSPPDPTSHVWACGRFGTPWNPCAIARWRMHSIIRSLSACVIEVANDWVAHLVNHTCPALGMLQVLRTGMSRPCALSYI